MPSTINASTSGLLVTSDASNILKIQSNGTDVITADATNGVSFSKIGLLIETCNINASAAGSTMAVPLASGSIKYYTVNSTSNFTLNFQYDGVTTLNASMSVGQSVSATVLVTNGSTAYYCSAIQVDGTSVTPKWNLGVAPTTGNVNSIDAYTFNIIKTAASTYTVLASMSKFA